MSIFVQNRGSRVEQQAEVIDRQRRQIAHLTERLRSTETERDEAAQAADSAIRVAERRGPQPNPRCPYAQAAYGRCSFHGPDCPALNHCQGCNCG
jgi:hypothetical protein